MGTNINHLADDLRNMDQDPQAAADALLTALVLPESDYQKLVQKLDEVLKPKPAGGVKDE